MMSKSQKWTRLSLLYPATVLLTAGAGLLFAQDIILTLFQSTGDYGRVIVQMAGMFMLVLSVFVWQTLRHGWSEMYVWTIVLRLFMAACFYVFFNRTGDPLFLLILGILLLGIVLTLIGILVDARRAMLGRRN